VVVLAVPLIVLGALDLQHYAISLTFGVLLVALSDPGGKTLRVGDYPVGEQAATAAASSFRCLL